jgi:hypothetical protein
MKPAFAILTCLLLLSWTSGFDLLVPQANAATASDCPCNGCACGGSGCCMAAPAGDSDSAPSTMPAPIHDRSGQFIPADAQPLKTTSDLQTTNRPDCFPVSSLTAAVPIFLRHCTFLI